VYQVVNWRC